MPARIRDEFTGLPPKKAHALRHPEKAKARRMVHDAVKRGRLVRMPCEHCGRADRVQAHHPDYSKPLDVMWLCLWCHWAEHRRIALPSKSSKMYELREQRRKEREEKWRAYWEASRPEREAQDKRRKARVKREQTFRTLAASGASLTVIAAAVGLTLSGASRFAQRRGIVGTWRKPSRANLDPAAVAALVADGLTQAQIGARFGVTAPTVCQFMKRHGIASWFEGAAA